MQQSFDAERATSLHDLVRQLYMQGAEALPAALLVENSHQINHGIAVGQMG